MTKGEVMERKRILALQLKLAELDKQREDLLEEMARQTNGLCPWEWAEKHEMQGKIWSTQCRRQFGEGCRWGGNSLMKNHCWHCIVFNLRKQR